MANTKYGAGDEKIGKIVGGNSRHGRELKEKFFKKIPALKRVVDWVQSEVRTKGELIGLDGRILPIRSAHAALNTLLQSAGAVVMKMALVTFYDSMVEEFGPHGERWGLCANVHDEFEVECEPDMAVDIAGLAEKSIRKAGEHFSLAIRLDGEAKIGDTWFEVH